MSRKPLDSEKIQAPSLPEIGAAYDAARARLGRKAGKPNKGEFLNAVVMYFLSLPEEEQQHAINEGVARYRHLQEVDDEGDPILPLYAPKARKPKG